MPTIAATQAAKLPAIKNDRFMISLDMVVAPTTDVNLEQFVSLYPIESHRHSIISVVQKVLSFAKPR